MLIGGIDTAEGRQQVIAELYEKFFKKVVPKTASSLGIVYTPVEIVDFINRAVNDLLDEHFDGASLSDEGVHVLDPFTGTGTFIARMIQSGLISPGRPRPQVRQRAARERDDAARLLHRRDQHRDRVPRRHRARRRHEPDSYEPFSGIVLTDTFQMIEADDSMDTVFFPRNNDRADRQKQPRHPRHRRQPALLRRAVQPERRQRQPRVPDPRRQHRAHLRQAFDSDATRTRCTTATYARSDGHRTESRLHRWWRGRLRHQRRLDRRQHRRRHPPHPRRRVPPRLHLQPSRQPTHERRTAVRKEGGKIFGSGSRNTVAITLLVRTPGDTPSGGAQIRYFETSATISSREEKLEIVARSSVDDLEWRRITPNEHADWVTQRRDRFDDFVALRDEEDAVFLVPSNGLQTARDVWVVSASSRDLRRLVRQTVKAFNDEVDQLSSSIAPRDPATAQALANRDPTKFSWNESDFKELALGRRKTVQGFVARCEYRPFFSQHLAFETDLIKRPSRTAELFPPGASNRQILCPSTGTKAPFTMWSSDAIASLHTINSDTTTVLARWRYPSAAADASLFDSTERLNNGGKVSNINPVAVEKFRDALGEDISDDDLFHYVYGVLHSADFRSQFEINLKKEAPRVPLVNDRAAFDSFVRGRIGASGAPHRL